MAENPPPNGLSRRTLLKWAAAVGGVSLFYSVFGKDRRTHLPEFTIPENDFIKLGPEEETMVAPFGIRFSPDGHIPFITMPHGAKEFYISGNNSSYAMVTNEQGILVPREADEKGRAIPVIGPDKRIPYRNGYTTITSVIPMDDPYHLIGIAHMERWPVDERGELIYTNFTGSIGLLESKDGGKSWAEKGIAIKATDETDPGDRVTGVGQPCAIVKEENGKKYAYVYYIHWPSKETKYQIYLSRAEIKEDSLGEFEHYGKDGFKAGEVNPETIAPVIPIQENIPKSFYTALPSISFNTHLNRYLAVFETDIGFCSATSEDGIKWEDSKLILKFPQGQYPHQMGQTWASNPSILSFDKPNDQITGKKGFLVYSRGVWDQPHYMVRRPFELE